MPPQILCHAAHNCWYFPGTQAIFARVHNILLVKADDPHKTLALLHHKLLQMGYKIVILKPDV
jgi:hypothetical protein